MMFENKKKLSEGFTHVKSDIYSHIITVFIISTLAIFPLYLDKQFYFTLLVAKYQYYYTSVLITLAVSLLAAVIRSFSKNEKSISADLRSFIAGLNPVKLWKKFTLIEKILAGLLIFFIISTLQSDYVYESFWGNEGRYNGLFLNLLYVFSTFLIIRLGHMKKWYLDLFIIVGVLICLFGITDYFRMDIFGLNAKLRGRDKDVFTSTIGNINIYTAYVALFLGAAAGLFCLEKKTIKSAFYYIAVLTGFFAIITGQSDNAYLALGALFAFLPLVLFATRSGIKRYILLIAGFVSIMKCIAYANDVMPGRVIGLSGLFSFITQYEKLPLIVIALWLLVAVLYIGDYLYFKNKKNEIGKKLCKAWLVFLILSAAALVGILYDANFGAHPEKYGSLSQYLVFRDEWGTNRGFCWRIALESYMQQPVHHKLFGYGPDTFGILTWDARATALDRFGVYFESAHNEYLQLLVTVGPIALFFYLAFLFLGCRMMMKNLKEKPWILAPLVAVICYAVQAFVNINLPIVTPVMWALLAIGIAACRKDYKRKSATK